LFTAGLQKNEIYLEGAYHTEGKAYKDIVELFGKLTSLQSWGNARDVQTLTKTMMGKVFANLTEKLDNLLLPATVATTVLEEMLKQRLKSETNNSQPPKKDELLLLMQKLDMIPS
jgi:hypothetical protein